ncbi:hypothetical protein ACFWUZ_17950 [Streptomyces sp. NPDC058646]|uniref:AAA family ATPase n=1 Tax=Streptomyces sp. NPDC058646 TaxID=3346574 RepID=UPI00364DBD12
MHAGGGQTTIIDAVNAAEEAREQWRLPAARHGVPVVFIEVVCPDAAVHRGWFEGRSRVIEGFREPAREAVELRRKEFVPWSDDRLGLDGMLGLPSNVAAALGFLAAAS